MTRERMKRSVSVAIRCAQADGAERVVAVLRPDSPDDPLGGLWGLPAATARDGESEDEAAARVLRDKLGLRVPAEGLTRISEGRRDDGASSQSMTVYALDWDEDSPLPVSLPARSVDSESTVTLYEDWRWAAPDELREAARRGSLCTRLYLKWLGDALDSSLRSE
ncbi:MAG: NUDIX hydrolase [Dehalococcoidia bacterium]|nr:NUDIX hydrolase [Dehalococcoidia bacterium]